LSHNTSYCLIEVIAKAGLTVLVLWGCYDSEIYICIICNQCLSTLQFGMSNSGPGEVYTISVVSDLRQISVFLAYLRFPPLIKLTTMIFWLLH